MAQKIATKMLVLVLAVAVAATATATPGVELTIKPFEQMFYKPLGQAMVFTCEMKVVDDGVTGEDGADAGQDGIDTATSGYRLGWFDVRNDEIVDKTGRRYVEDEDNLAKKLYITDIRADDEGVYRCGAIADGKPTTYKNVTLKLYKDIKFDYAATPQHPRVNTDAIVKCIVSGEPAPVISWRYKAQRLLTPDKGRYSEVPDGLIIRNITMADDGEYTCRAEVEKDGRYDERRISVEVHIPPAITEGPGKVEGIEDQEATMACKASGMPSPSYEFYKDGVRVETTSRVIVNTTAGTIHFKPLTKADESANYNCTATNDVGSDSSIGELKVLVKPFVTELKELRVAEGLKASMLCVSKGDPAPDMTFQKVGESAAYQMGDSEDGSVTVAAPGEGRLELTLNSLKPSDAGEYKCSAVNKIGNHEAVAKLTVMYKPRFAADHKNMEHIWASKTRNVTCHAQSEPEPVIEWKRGTVPLANNDTYQIFSDGHTSVLQVTVRESDQSWIYGEYTCMAKNLYGDGEIKINLTRASVPGQPGSFETVYRKPTEIALRVVRPVDDGGMPITGYRVEYSNVEEPASAVTVDGTGPPYETATKRTTDYETEDIVIKGLTPSTTYDIRVSAKNEVGVGSPAPRFDVKTEDIRTPYPLKISSESDSESSSKFHVKWNSPDNGGEPITEYEFRYKQVQLKDGQSEELDRDWTSIQRSDLTDQQQLVIDRLKPNTQYLLQIRARNKIGWSEFSEKFYFRTAPESEADIAKMKQSASFGAPAAIAIVIVIVIVVLIVTDVSCYFLNHCGILMCVCRRLRPTGPHSKAASEKEMEAGERQHLKTCTDDDKDEETKEALKVEIRLENMEEDEDAEKNAKSVDDDGDPPKA